MTGREFQQLRRTAPTSRCLCGDAIIEHIEHGTNCCTQADCSCTGFVPFDPFWRNSADKLRVAQIDSVAIHYGFSVPLR